MKAIDYKIMYEACLEALDKFNDDEDIEIDYDEENNVLYFVPTESVEGCNGMMN